MLKRFYPKHYYDNVLAIPFEELAKNYKGVIFDIDNTLEYYDVPVPSENILILIEQLKNLGYNIALVSNNSAERVNTFNENLNLVAIYDAHKPSKKPILDAMKLLGTTQQNTMIVGDQIFTDVLCGNMTGITTICVKPIKPDNLLQVKMKRKIEFVILKFYNRKVKKSLKNK